MIDKTVALLNCHEDDVYCFRREVIFALAEHGYRVVLSCPEGHRLDVFRNKENIFIEDVVIDRRGTNPIRDFKLLLSYRRLLKKYKPDVVCTFTIKPNIYGSIAADLAHIPHINNITGLGSGFQNGGLVQKIVKALYKIALVKSKMVYFQNKDNMDTALEVGLVPKHVKYECIPGSGVNLEHFKYLENVHRDQVVFNYIGRVLKDKRVDDYIDAARTIKKKYRNVVFNILGFVEPSELHYVNLLKELEADGIVHYCGSVDDVRPYIYASDAIIHPSSYGEGISNVLLETAASGRAIITTDVPGCKDVVDVGVNGFIYHAEDVNQLVERIERFIQLTPEERTKMGKAGRSKVEKEFDRNVVVHKYLSAVDRLV